MYEKALSILFFTILILVKITRHYILEDNDRKNRIIDEEQKLDDLVKLNYKHF